jgi:N-acetylglutamate synthase-like GNAT family acetyltransferase
MILKTPSDKEFEQVCKYICELELDNRDLKQQEFIAAFFHDQLVGFGRLRQHTDCVELCSLGIIPDHQGKGIGKAIVSHLINSINQTIYLVCIIPEFFSQFGFKEVEKFPGSIENKINYCTKELIVPETYVAMALQR